MKRIGIQKSKRTHNQPINADGKNVCGLTVKFGGPLVIGIVMFRIKMNKFASIILGAVLSLVISSVAVQFILTPIMHDTGKSPESLMGYSFLIIYPISIFLGSMLTGAIIDKNGIDPFKNHLLVSPGLYLSAPYVIGILSAPILSLLLVLATLLNILLSYLGILAGIKMRKHNKPINSDGKKVCGLEV